MREVDENWMRRALELAERGRGYVEPNPLVGAVIVRDGQVVVRPVGYVSVTFDHRVVDGARAAAFGLSVIARLERA